MKQDGLSFSTITSATTKEQVKKLKKVQDHLWAIMGLKAGIDKLKSLGYDVVAQCTPEGEVSITIQLKVHLDFDNGNVNGQDIMTRINELKGQIKSLEEKDEQNKT